MTTITGRVVAGTLPAYGAPDPVPNVVVYVPNAPLQTFRPGVQCNPCGADLTGNPLVSAKTRYDGTFSIANVPAGSGIPLVIQLGRWRREVSVDIPACTSTAVGDIRMPRNQGEGDIPLTAISTGSVDPLECVLLKMGVDPQEFTPSSGTGRIHLYTSTNDPGSGASAGPDTLGETWLMDAGGTYMNYDQILFPCWGFRSAKNANELANLVRYANAGGRFFATHFSYSWLYQNSPFNATAQWNVDYTFFDSQISANVQLPATNPEGAVFSEWLGAAGALSQASPPQVLISSPRHDIDAVQGASVDWIDSMDTLHPGRTPWLLHYAFDTPLGATSPCGRVIYSDFHVTSGTTGPNQAFPSECDGNPLSAPRNPRIHNLGLVFVCHLESAAHVHAGHLQQPEYRVWAGR